MKNLFVGIYEKFIIIFELKNVCFLDLFTKSLTYLFLPFFFFLSLKLVLTVAIFFLDYVLFGHPELCTHGRTYIIIFWCWQLSQSSGGILLCGITRVCCFVLLIIHWTIICSLESIKHTHLFHIIKIVSFDFNDLVWSYEFRF